MSRALRAGGKEIQLYKREKDQKESDLLRVHATDKFPQPIYEALAQDRSLLLTVARQLLDDHFHRSLHHRILEAVGVELR